MIRRMRFLTACFAVLALVLASGPTFAQSRGKGQAGKGQHQNGQGKAKQHKHVSGKDLLGDKIKQNGRHKIQDHGKFSTFVDVQNGKIAGVSVKHADRGDVPVTKYKSTKKMAEGPKQGIQLVSTAYAQEVAVTVYIGYAYVDDYGDEVIYWFPSDMILDGESGAVEYYDPGSGY